MTGSVRGRRLVAVLAASAMTLAAVVVPASLASAADGAPPPVQQRAASGATADPLPTVQIESVKDASGDTVKGAVLVQEVVGTTVYAGGYFDHVRPAGAAPGTQRTARSNLLAFDIRTGELISSFAPAINGQVKALQVSPDGTRLYVGGSFTQVDGQSRWNMAAFDTATGALVPGFRAVVGGSYVNAIEVTDSAVYAGGLFTAGVGAARQNLMAFDLRGTLLPWAPTADLQVDAMTLTPNADKLIVGGRFAQVNGVSQRGLVALDLADGSILDWAAPQTVQNGWNEAPYVGKAGILSLYADDSAVYGTGWVYANKTVGNLEGTFAAEPGSGEIRWIADCHGDTVSVYSDNTTVYTTGHNHDCRTVGGFPDYDPKQAWNSVALTADVKGTLIQGLVSSIYADWSGYPAPAVVNWFPNDWVSGGLIDGNPAFSTTGAGGYVSIGGDFIGVNGKAQQGLVRFGASSVVDARQGPELSGADWAATAVSVRPGAARVSVLENWDRDDIELTYELFRQGVAAPLDTAVGRSPTWLSRSLVLDDTTAEPGATYRYRVRAADPDGNTATSAWAEVAIADGVVSPYALAVLDDDPYLYWPFQETSGATTADWAGASPGRVDSGVSRGVDGAIAGTGSLAFGFDGSSDGLVATQSPIPGPQVFTVETWFRGTSSAGGKIIGFGSKTSDLSNTYDRHIYLRNDGRLVFGVYPGTTKIVTSPSAYRDGAWHHVVGTLGSDGLALFVDGAQVARDRSVTSAQEYNGYWRVGGDKLNGWPNRPTADYLDADIDEAAVYERVLTAGEIENHYRTGMGGGGNQSPSASFTSSVSDLTADFDGSASSDPDGSVASFAWQFGDGASGSGATPQHTYSSAGTYPVTLTVTDEDGGTDSATDDVTVGVERPNAAPTALFASSVTDLAVDVDASASADSDGAIVSYDWDFGDGSTGAGVTARHVYAAAGAYPVSLTVTDDDGATSVVAGTVSVSVAAPPPKPPVAKKSPTVKLNAPNKAKLRVNVDPNLPGAKAWKVEVLKKKGDKYVKVRTVRTKGKNEIRVVDVPRGRYIVRAPAQRGYAKADSRSVFVRR